MRRLGVVLLPGSVLPAELAYANLLKELGDERDVVAKNLEVYAGDEPPPDYSLDTEVDGVLRSADELGFDRFHLVGYSGGGASALAVTAKHPGRVASLALLEPAWAGNWQDQTPEHRALWEKYEELDPLPPPEFMAGFTKIALRPGVVPPAPPPGDPPPWMRLRPAGIRAFLKTFKTYDLDREALAGFQGPVYFALGGLSNPDEYGEIGQRLARTFPDFTLEVFPERHHFDPPHRVEPARVAASLQALWERAETRG